MTIPFHCGVTISRVSFVYWQLWLIEWVGNRTNPGTGFQKAHRGSFPSLVYNVEQRTRHGYHTPRPLLSNRNTTQVQVQTKRHLWSTLFNFDTALLHKTTNLLLERQQCIFLEPLNWFAVVRCNHWDNFRVEEKLAIIFPVSEQVESKF